MLKFYTPVCRLSHEGRGDISLIYCLRIDITSERNERLTKYDSVTSAIKSIRDRGRSIIGGGANTLLILGC